jgi:hypothetical protein
MSIRWPEILILPSRYQSSTFQWSSGPLISTGARRSATGRYIHVPWSLTTTRSTARSLQGAGIVRPAQHSHVFMLPVTGRSAAITPFGPQAAHAASASSTSVSGRGLWADLYASGPRSVVTVRFWLHVSVSGSPVSYRYPMPNRRLRTVLSNRNTDGVSVNAWESCCCSVGSRAVFRSLAWYSGLKSTCSVWTAMTHSPPDSASPLLSLGGAGRALIRHASRLPC